MSQTSSRISSTRPTRRRRPVAVAGVAIIAVAAVAGLLLWKSSPHSAASAMAPPPPVVTVSLPLQRDVSGRQGFLGQFSAVDRVELRAQVGGVLTEIDFKDGQIVRKGDLLFVIDPRPYEIKLAQARAQYKTATARLALANSEFWRAQQLKRTDFGTAENVDQRSADQQSAQAALDQAEAAVQDASLDLSYCHVQAPFSGRIGDHQVSIGNLISGSRAGSSATTLLATIVSLDPIHLDFNMSESDFLTFSHARAHEAAALADRVEISLSDEGHFARTGTLDFVDNSLDRASGTIHARATVPNPDLFLTPGEFARLRLTISNPRPALLVPAAAVVPDQSNHLLLIAAADGTVVPRPVQIGDMRGGLRVVTAGLKPTDRVIVDGLMHAMPGTKVSPKDSTIQFDAVADGEN